MASRKAAQPAETRVAVIVCRHCGADRVRLVPLAWSGENRVINTFLAECRKVAGPGHAPDEVAVEGPREIG